MASGPHRKIALVIGIGDYASGKKLSSTINDARNISSKLDEMGFVSDGPKLDLKYEKMVIELVTFKRSIKQGDIVIFYFAGHGIQWEVTILSFLKRRDLLFYILIFIKFVNHFFV